MRKGEMSEKDFRFYNVTKFFPLQCILYLFYFILFKIILFLRGIFSNGGYVSL